MRKQEMSSKQVWSECYLGIEFGSTRIKAVLIDEQHQVIAQGAHEWENKIIDGIWTYALDDVILGLQEAYHHVKKEVKEKYDILLHHIDGIGISGMMHGYLVFDQNDELLVPFRTWRNTITKEASEQLTSLFQYHIPQRWSIAHLYQAMSQNETHCSSIRFQTTLAGYVHYRLTGEKVLGISEASGMFPIALATGNFDARMMQSFDEIVKERHLPWTLQEIFPTVLRAGEYAGVLHEEGAALLDPEGDLEAGIPCCPPEGDAGTGMVATNSIDPRSGNVSAGTSIFAMVVLEHELKKVYDAIDLVTTPTGNLVAMVHCNNGTSEINAWVQLFQELLTTLDIKVADHQLYQHLFQTSMMAKADGGGLLACNYLSGEHITGCKSGVPLFLRKPQGTFDLANFMLTLLYSSIVTLRMGMDILMKDEQIILEQIVGHGGFFKTPEVGQRIMAAALHTPVSVMETAGEGGAWGCAVLARYGCQRDQEETLEAYLCEKVFANTKMYTVQAEKTLQEGFDQYLVAYQSCLSIEKVAIKELQEEKEKEVL